MGSGRRQESTLGELLALLAVPVVWLVRLCANRRRAGPEEIMRFYRSKEWKALRYASVVQTLQEFLHDAWEKNVVSFTRHKPVFWAYDR